MISCPHGLTRVEPVSEAVDAWVAHFNAADDATLLPQAKHSWYLGANIPGRARVFMSHAGGVARYRKVFAQAAARNREGIRQGA